DRFDVTCTNRARPLLPSAPLPRSRRPGGAPGWLRVGAVGRASRFAATIETSPPGRGQELHDGRHAIVDPALLVALDAAIGDTISIGETELTVIGTLERLPGDIEIASSFAPRGFMPAAFLDRSEERRVGEEWRMRG